MKQAIFDMDGTLLDTMIVWQTLAARLLARYGLELEPCDENLTARMSSADAILYLRAHYGIPAELPELQAAVFDILMDFYRSSAVVKPGAGEFLTAMQQAGIPFGLVTATREPLVRTALDRAGLGKFFSELLFCCPDYGTSKREALPFQRMREQLGNASEAETVVFEDAYYAGFTAKAAGFKLAVLQEPSEPKAEKLRAMADWYFETWDEALAAFKSGQL